MTERVTAMSKSKEKASKALNAFLDKCLKCEEYDNGNCPVYDREMDLAFLENKEPHCDKEI